MDFELQRREQDGVIVIKVRGAIDLSSSGALATVLSGALEARKPVVVDACGVDFIDSTGLRVLLDGRSAQSRSLLEFALACEADGSVARMLKVAGAGRFLQVHPSVDAAVAALRPAR